LRERLGAGGMGEVYRAEHRYLQRPCAVKLIRPELGDDPALLARFEREVQATAALTHPNTVQVFDYGREDDGTFYYVMEYLPGDSIQQIVERDGPIAAQRTARLLVQVCGALHEAHLAGLTHRDIKPSNVIVCERGAVQDCAKLLDFGLVKPANMGSADPGTTQAGMLLGTPAFMSPEQAAGDPVGPASDIYSTGALAYYMLTGRHLFAGKAGLQMMLAHLHETPRPMGVNGDVAGARLERVVMQCLAKDPAARPRSAAELSDALSKCLKA
jgi:serine/threonine-protein kinase